MVVDSFKLRNRAAVLRYMHLHGHDPTDIEFVVGTHWDNDHMAGLDQVLASAPNAELISHSVVDPQRLARLVAEAEVVSSLDWSGGAEAFGAAVDVARARGNPIQWVQARSFLCRERDLSILAMSPTIAAVETGRAAVARELRSNPRPDGSAAIAVEPNLTSVTLWVETDTHAVVLGADLENDETYGWRAAISETARHRLHGPASLVKVPHHGSPDADDSEMWNVLLAVQPLAVLTPFSTMRPRPSDVLRIQSRSKELRIAAGPGWSGRAAAIMQSAVPRAEVDERREACFVSYDARSSGRWDVQTGYL